MLAHSEKSSFSSFGQRSASERSPICVSCSQRATRSSRSPVQCRAIAQSATSETSRQPERLSELMSGFITQISCTVVSVTVWPVSIACRSRSMSCRIESFPVAVSSTRKLVRNERSVPRARGTLRSFLTNFLVDDTATGKLSIRHDIDLERHAIDTGQTVTDTTVQEICVMKPDMSSLNLSGCREVSDVALWAIARHCTGLRELRVARCEQLTQIGLRSLALRCPKLEKLDFSECASIDLSLIHI